MLPLSADDLAQVDAPSRPPPLISAVTLERTQTPNERKFARDTILLSAAFTSSSFPCPSPPTAYLRNLERKEKRREKGPIKKVSRFSLSLSLIEHSRKRYFWWNLVKYRSDIRDFWSAEKSRTVVIIFLRTFYTKICMSRHRMINLFIYEKEPGRFIRIYYECEFFALFRPVATFSALIRSRDE